MKIDIQVEDDLWEELRQKGFLEDVVITVANKEYVFSFITNERLQHELRVTLETHQPRELRHYSNYIVVDEISPSDVRQAVQVVMSCDPRVLQYYARDSQSA